MKVKVLGGGGFLGLSVVPALQARGVTPVCGRRVRSNVLGLRALKVPLVLCDLDAPETVQAALCDTDVLVHLAGHYPRLSVDPVGALETATRQMRTVLDAAAAGGVRRLVYVSSTATVAPREPVAAGGSFAEAPRSDESDRFAAAPRWGTYHAVKWHLEAQVEEEARFETVTACPGACLGPHDYKLGTAAFLAATARRLQPAHPDGWVNAVDVRDVGDAVAQLATLAHVPRRVLVAGEPLRLHRLLESIAPRYGAPPPRPALSAAEAVALADAEEHRAAREGGRASLSRELVDLVVHGVPVDAGLSMRALGLNYRPLSETLDAFDAWAHRIGLLSPSPSSSPVVQEVRA
jgi:dihydroflavonol-4-reductase